MATLHGTAEIHPQSKEVAVYTYLMEDGAFVSSLVTLGLVQVRRGQLPIAEMYFYPQQVNSDNVFRIYFHRLKVENFDDISIFVDVNSGQYSGIIQPEVLDRELYKDATHDGRASLVLEEPDVNN